MGEREGQQLEMSLKHLCSFFAYWYKHIQDDYIQENLPWTIHTYIHIYLVHTMCTCTHLDVRSSVHMLTATLDTKWGVGVGVCGSFGPGVRGYLDEDYSKQAPFAELLVLSDEVLHSLGLPTGIFRKKVLKRR